MVKNEVDIIESFIRYNSKIVDEMIILDNGSTDDTVNVINNLINEGLSIALIHDEDSFYNQDVKMTKLCIRQYMILMQISYVLLMQMNSFHHLREIHVKLLKTLIYPLFTM